MHVSNEGHARPGWTTSRRGQDCPWKSQSEWQRTEINGGMVWPTLGSRTAKDQIRTEQLSLLHDAPNIVFVYVYFITLKKIAPAFVPIVWRFMFILICSVCLRFCGPCCLIYRWWWRWRYHCVCVRKSSTGGCRDPKAASSREPNTRSIFCHQQTGNFTSRHVYVYQSSNKVDDYPLVFIVSVSLLRKILNAC